MPFTLLIGGARSGKTRLAERLAQAAGGRVIMIATAEAGDDEMATRIRRHQEDRPGEWGLVEESLDLCGAISSAADTDTLVIDCLTLWAANRYDDPDLEDDAVRAAGILAVRAGTGIVITNEVGSGIVPDNVMARNYRDRLGRINGVFAANASVSYLVVAGKVIKLETMDA